MSWHAGTVRLAGVVCLAGVVLAAGTLPASAQQRRVTRGANRQNCVPCQPGTTMRSPSMQTSPSSPNTPSSPSDPSSPTDPNAPANPSAPSDPNAPATPNAQNPAAPQDPAQAMTNPDQVFNSNNAAANQSQAASNAQSAAPNTIGDFFGATGVSTHYTGAAGSIGSLGTAKKIVGPYSSVVGRQKFIENQNLIPLDRVFVNYSYFGDVPLTPPGLSVNRWTYGMEKTFGDGMTSIEVRLPTATTLDSNVKTTDDNLSGTNFELGNVNFTGKVVIARSDSYIVTAGTAVTLPTADNLRIYAEDTGLEALHYENRSVHILPFLGVQFTPTCRSFTQLTVQLDFDVNGNPVSANTDDGFQRVGVANDATYVFASWTAGYWLTKDCCCGRMQSGLAPMVELHYNGTVRDADAISFDDGGTSLGIGTRSPLGGGNNDGLGFEALNLTVGLHALLNPNTSLTVGYAVPVAGANHEDEFNGEARVLLNCYFGRSGASNGGGSCGQGNCCRQY